MLLFFPTLVGTSLGILFPAVGHNCKLLKTSTKKNHSLMIELGLRIEM